MTGKELRDKGALSAALHQKKLKSFWEVKALAALINLVKSKKGSLLKTFTKEQEAQKCRMLWVLFFCGQKRTE